MNRAVFATRRGATVVLACGRGFKGARSIMLEALDVQDAELAVEAINAAISTPDLRTPAEIHAEREERRE